MQRRSEHAITLPQYIPQYIYTTYQPHVQAREGTFPDGGYFLPNFTTFNRQKIHTLFSPAFISSDSSISFKTDVGVAFNNCDWICENRP